MALCLEPRSEQAHALAAYVSRLICNSESRKRQSEQTKQAVASVIADLLAAYQQSPDEYCFRPLGKSDFDGQRIGYRPAKAALDGLMDLDLLHYQPGFRCGFDRNKKGQAARYAAKPGLLKLALRHGITPENWSAHFRPAPRAKRVAHPVIVRAKSEFWHDDRKGGKLPIDKADLNYQRAAAQVVRINAYMADQVITGCEHQGFARIFNQGDQPGFVFNMGGRLYSLGADSYQNMKRAERPGIRINGEPVVELDIRSSHLTILYGLKGLIPEPGDPYGLPDIPRAVAKAWLTMTLGYGKFQTRWPKDTVAKMMEEEGIDLKAEYPIEVVRAKMLARHPILSDWPASPLNWADLQYVESCAVIDAVEELALKHDVPALPLHDALIIPVYKIATARGVLTRTFGKHVGIAPVLTLKGT